MRAGERGKGSKGCWVVTVAAGCAMTLGVVPDACDGAMKYDEDIPNIMCVCLCVYIYLHTYVYPKYLIYIYIYIYIYSKYSSILHIIFLGGTRGTGSRLAEPAKTPENSRPRRLGGGCVYERESARERERKRERERRDLR